jgi:transposase
VGEGKNSKQIAKELDKEEQTVINYVGKVAHELIRLHENGVNPADGKPAQVEA